MCILALRDQHGTDAYSSAPHEWHFDYEGHSTGMLQPTDAPDHRRVVHESHRHGLLDLTKP